MAFFEKINTLKRLDLLIRTRQIGTSESLSKILNISQRTFFNYLDELRSRGAIIEYSKVTKSYFYVKIFVLKF